MESNTLIAKVTATQVRPRLPCAVHAQEGSSGRSWCHIIMQKKNSTFFQNTHFQKSIPTHEGFSSNLIGDRQAGHVDNIFRLSMKRYSKLSRICMVFESTPSP